ncbi:hypothetical protein N0B51_05445 [Tsuneonella sp. YG55]|uniref:Uncharacterized protein n=1 Tax=Tsuneonella litorea TaxID=2976475 RepID=A0A9X3A914_9SPHN|nr:hypothetical protein [Tsuneonella litorea]MCT2558420.1 hypothetical protein [Tsuneonella litorea]
MSKTPPIPVQPGEKYCFVCEQALPLASFRPRNGKLYSPCRSCARTSHERTAPMRELIEELMTGIQERAAVRRPATPEEERLFAPMDGFARWIMRREAQAKKPKRATRKPQTRSGPSHEIA